MSELYRHLLPNESIFYHLYNRNSMSYECGTDFYLINDLAFFSLIGKIHNLEIYVLCIIDHA